MNTVSSTLLGVLAFATAPAVAGECKRIHAEMIEVAATEGCNPPLTSCFLGEVDGNHGLRGTTHFKADGIGGRPTTSPDFLPYSGPFEYHTRSGSLYMRETGITDPKVVTAYQQVVDATGEYSGHTGHFFVSGHKLGGGVITTRVTGQLCRPD